MFFIGYIAAELRRRFGRTVLTALGLAVGVGLVVTVTALSSGLAEAQSKVLRPLTGVGTDMSVTRPLARRRFGRSRAASGGSFGATTPARASGSRTSASPASTSRATTSSPPSSRCRRAPCA